MELSIDFACTWCTSKLSHDDVMQNICFRWWRFCDSIFWCWNLKRLPTNYNVSLSRSPFVFEICLFSSDSQAIPSVICAEVKWILVFAVVKSISIWCYSNSNKTVTLYTTHTISFLLSSPMGYPISCHFFCVRVTCIQFLVVCLATPMTKCVPVSNLAKDLQQNFRRNSITMNFKWISSHCRLPPPTIHFSICSL